MLSLKNKTISPKTLSTVLKYNFTKYYTKSHEWIDVKGNKGKSGISVKAAHDLGDIVFVELPNIGESFPKEESYGAIESVKAASDIFMPVEGEIVSVNEELVDTAGLINEDAEGKGWVVEIQIANTEEVKELMNEQQYKKFCEQEEH
ncbi:glycine cleavage system h protein [Anaeramoeba flamelloides]|uniref:Glycine cleavage system H protein n=1 Tax=Anaeramoeba flamelloides TaxID=1746091 RepID=A0AAV7ZFH4_9EUKA|nr:glycine cleavage system h protein [Anaeramoeba flamelloides]KAJ6253084.1 glycine cleavage system h protein [Anaeramoeba flamelloides]